MEYPNWHLLGRGRQAGSGRLLQRHRRAGSSGPRRFRLPATVGRMTAEHGKLRAKIVELSGER